MTSYLIDNDVPSAETVWNDYVRLQYDVRSYITTVYRSIDVALTHYYQMANRLSQQGDLSSVSGYHQAKAQVVDEQKESDLIEGLLHCLTLIENMQKETENLWPNLPARLLSLPSPKTDNTESGIPGFDPLFPDRPMVNEKDEINNEMSPVEAAQPKMEVPVRVFRA